jgi:hypothetical protein
VFVEYAQAEPGDMLMKITAWNRGPDEAPLHLMPQLVLRNTWSWSPGAAQAGAARRGRGAIAIEPAELGDVRLYADGCAELLFTENESNAERLWGSAARILSRTVSTSGSSTGATVRESR